MKKINIIIGAVIVIAVVAIFFWVKSAFKDNYLELGTNEHIDATPTQIQSIRAIGEWEFLSVSAEEMVDTVRKGFFSDGERTFGNITLPKQCVTCECDGGIKLE